MTMTQLTSTAPAPGFAHPVPDAQQTFRATLDALALPLRPVRLSNLPERVGALSPAAAAIALTLCDDDTPVWLDATLSADPAVRSWLAFHTAAPVVEDAADALFVFVSSPSAIPSRAALMIGTDEAPHVSATVVAVLDDTQGSDLLASGPGFKEPLVWSPPALPDGFLGEWHAAAHHFPSGIDLFFASEDTVTGLPRTTKLVATHSVEGN